MKVRRIVILLLRLMLGGIFLYAAYTKLRQPWFIFAMSIDAYHVFPEWASLTIARVLPWGELGLGLVLLSGLWLRVSSAAASVLLASFFGLMLWAYSKGLAIDCGCFGAGEALGPMTLLRDGSLLLASIALAVMAWSERPRQVSRIDLKAREYQEI